MTTNAVFVDVRLVLGSGTTEAPLIATLEALENGEPNRAERPLATAAVALAAAKDKLGVWDRRQDLHDELAVARMDLSPVRQRDLDLAVTNASQRPATTGWGWSTRFTELAVEESACSESLTVLRSVVDELGTVAELSRRIVALASEPEPDLFSDPAQAAAERLRSFLTESGALFGLEESEDGSLRASGDDHGPARELSFTSMPSPDLAELIATARIVARQ